MQVRLRTDLVSELQRCPVMITSIQFS